MILKTAPFGRGSVMLAARMRSYRSRDRQGAVTQRLKRDVTKSETYSGSEKDMPAKLTTLASSMFHCS
jgi:hypothetical protein